MELTRGKRTFGVQERMRITIISDGPFYVYGHAGGSRRTMYGPVASTHRRLVFVVMPGDEEIEVECKDQVQWNMHVDSLPNPRETPDPRKIADVMEKPLTLREELRRYVREQISQAAEASGQAGSFEEEDDFEIEDEVPDPLSPYELLVMADEEGYPSDKELNSSPAEQENAGKESARDEALESNEKAQAQLQEPDSSAKASDSASSPDPG